MLDFLDAPVPYIIGLDPKHLPNVEFADDVYVYDLQKNKTYRPLDVDPDFIQQI